MKYGALCCPDFPHAEMFLPATIAFSTAKLQIFIVERKNRGKKLFHIIRFNGEQPQRLGYKPAEWFLVIAFFEVYVDS